jgi:hypothetical protein
LFYWHTLELDEKAQESGLSPYTTGFRLLHYRGEREIVTVQMAGKGIGETQYQGYSVEYVRKDEMESNNGPYNFYLRTCQTRHVV